MGIRDTTYYGWDLLKTTRAETGPALHIDNSGTLYISRYLLTDPLDGSTGQTIVEKSNNGGKSWTIIDFLTGTFSYETKFFYRSKISSSVMFHGGRRPK